MNDVKGNTVTQPPTGLTESTTPTQSRFRKRNLVRLGARPLKNERNSVTRCILGSKLKLWTRFCMGISYRAAIIP